MRNILDFFRKKTVEENSTSNSKNKIFYKLNAQCEYKHVGNFPQIQKYKKGYDTQRRNSMTQASRYFFSQNPGPELDVDGLILAPRAKLTNFLTSNAFSDNVGLLVSERLLKIIQSVTCVNYVVYRAPIYNKNEEIIVHYYYMHYTKELPELIDFKNSELHTDDYEKPQKISFKDEGDYHDFKVKNPHSLIIPTVKVVYKFDVEKFDVFRDGILFSDTLISEKVMQIFIDNKITGLDYIKITNIFINED